MISYLQLCFLLGWIVEVGCIVILIIKPRVNKKGKRIPLRLIGTSKEIFMLAGSANMEAVASEGFSLVSVDPMTGQATGQPICSQRTAKPVGWAKPEYSISNQQLTTGWWKAEGAESIEVVFTSNALFAIRTERPSRESILAAICLSGFVSIFWYCFYLIVATIQKAV